MTTAIRHFIFGNSTLKFTGDGNMPGGNWDGNTEPNIALEVVIRELTDRVILWIKFHTRDIFSFSRKVRSRVIISFYSFNDYPGLILQNKMIEIKLDWRKFKGVIRKNFPGRKIPLFRFENTSLVDTDEVVIFGHFLRSNRIYIYTYPHIAYAYASGGIEGVKLRLLNTILHELGHWKCIPGIFTFCSPFNSRFYYFCLGVLFYLLFSLPFRQDDSNLVLIPIVAVLGFISSILKYMTTNIELPEADAINFEKNAHEALGEEINSCLSVTETRLDY